MGSTGTAGCSFQSWYPGLNFLTSRRIPSIVAILSPASAFGLHQINLDRITGWDRINMDSRTMRLNLFSLFFPELDVFPLDLPPSCYPV